MAGMVVQHNMNALNAYNKLNVNVNGLKKSSEKLSSGYRINRAGDDAAGLAISEKMRSQIRGLTQAKRNSQDGISMIQTFEGAAQETHAILQRMKELAAESANGTYDNSTDRAAIQLEFDQLNDELNQIADTDFNGTVVLNGGQMADGLTQVDGEFNYANKESQILAKAKEALRADITAANKSITDAQKAMKTEKFDLSAKGDAPEWNSVDDNKYNKTAADELWKKLGIVDGANNVDTSAITEVTATFKYNSTDKKWEVDSIVGNNGASYDVAALETKVADNNNSTTATGLGGFYVGVANGTTFTTTSKTVNAIFDATNAKDGDTVTLTFTNGANTQLAPKNAGWAENSVSIDDKGGSPLAAPTVALNTLTDADINKEIADKFNALNGQSIEISYSDLQNAATPSITIGGTALTGNAIKTAGDTVTINGQNYFIKGDDDANSDVISIFDKDGGKKLMDITVTTSVGYGTGAAGAGTVGKVSATLALDTALYTDSSAAVDVTVGENTALSTSEKCQKQIADARDQLAKLADYNITDYDSAKAYLTSKGVSISDSFDNSTARMTYTDNLTLQTGARTKDSVNFTFNYNTDKTADMGELKANLNISARADGLNTENLSLANQDDANYAIDQIDKAINKVSMVRASFGSIQNRLEHKIENLTTTNENLTEAESTIRDTDMASEMLNYTKYNILQQAAQSMLAQANQQPQSVLQLLG